MQTIKTQCEHGKIIVDQYDGATELADKFELTASDRYYGRNAGSDFNGNVSSAQAAKMMRVGDDTIVADADKMMTALQDAFTFEVKKYQNVNDVAGGFPDIAAFLAGAPTSMIARRPIVDDSAPLAIIVDLVSSGGVNARDLMKRGAAILALVQLLANARPVKLYASAMMLPRGSKVPAAGVYFPIDTAPLDLTRAAHILSHQSVARRILFDAACKASGIDGSGDISWPFNNVDKYRKAAPKIWSDIIGHDEADVLFIPAMFYNDRFDGDNAVEWVKEYVAKYGGKAVTVNS